MTSFECPYMCGFVELTDERRQHIADRHPELLPELDEKLAFTLAEPDQVRRSARFANARLFSRSYNDDRGSKHIVIVVVSDDPAPRRHWVVTAYVARSLAAGDVEWERS